MQYKSRAFDLVSNVEIRVIDKKTDKIIQRERAKNDFVTQGKNWLRNLMRILLYPETHPTYDLSDAAGSNSRPRYMAVGVGGNQQTTEGHLNSQAMALSVSGLEDPVAWEEGKYLKEIDAQGNLTDTQVFPYDGAIVYRCVFGVDHITFDGNVSIEGGVNVADNAYVSEALLVTSRHDRDEEPSTGELVEAIAYVNFPPIHITPELSLELLWKVE